MADSRTDQMSWQVLRLRARYRVWRRRANRRAAEPLTSRLDAVARRLDLEDRELPHTRAALYVLRPAASFPWFLVVVALATFVAAVRLSPVLEGLVLSAADRAAYRHLDVVEHFLRSYGQAFHHFTAEGNKPGPLGIYDFLVSLTLVALTFLPAMLLGSTGVGRSTSFRYMLNLKVLTALDACADAAEVPAVARQRKLRKLDRACRNVEDAVFGAHRRAGTIPRRSPRRALARQHAAKVVAILREQSALLDTDPQRGFRDLSRTLATIGERYAAGRVGALLDTDGSQAQPVSPIREAVIETVRLAVALVVATATAALTSALLPELPVRIPEQAQSWIVFGLSATTALLVSGWRVFSKIVDLIPGRK
ncbi:hypothetical protein ACIQBJ_08210 [Kitasatospora sp. NPDC088391]|uniref:hypothetical protein n=1 Tax=Kitasatospora sp. NPDC088391 TaxID=3364074 RepID=UPI0037FA7BD2